VYELDKIYVPFSIRYKMMSYSSRWTGMKLERIVTKIGLILFIMGLLVIGITLLTPVEKWIERRVILDGKGDIRILHHYEKFLTYNFTIDPQLYRNLSIKLWVYSKFPKNVSLISNDLRVRLHDITQYESKLPITPLELRKGIKFEINNIWSSNITSELVPLKIITPLLWRDYSVKHIDLTDALCSEVRNLIREKGLKIQGFTLYRYNLTIFGEAFENSGRKFNLLILDEGNYTRYFKGLKFKAYWSGTNSSSYAFVVYNYSIFSRKVYFVFELSKELNIEKEHLMIVVPRDYRFTTKIIRFFHKTPQAVGNITIACILREEEDRKFNFYLFKGSELYFSGKGKSYYEINMSIPLSESTSKFNLIVEKNIPEEIRVSFKTTKSWYIVPKYEILLKVFANYSRIILEDKTSYYIALLWEEKVKKPLDELLSVGEIIIILGAFLLLVGRSMRKSKS